LVKENYLTITATTAIRTAIVTAIITVVVIAATVVTIAEVFAVIIVIVADLAKEWDIQIMNKLGKRDSENTLVYQEELQKS